MAEELTTKQKRFCEEYIVDFNATQAAIRAGYSNKTARSIANENLKKPEVENYLKELTRELKSDDIIESKDLLRYLSGIIRGTVTEQLPYYTASGEVKYTEVRPRIKDGLKAAEMLMKYYDLYNAIDIKDPLGTAFVNDLMRINSGEI